MMLFGVVYVLYRPRVFSYAISRLHNPVEAEDATSEIMAKVVEGLPRFDLRPNVPFSTWIFKIARNYMISEGRRPRSKVELVSISGLSEFLKSKEIWINEDYFLRNNEDPAEEVLRKIRYEQALQAINSLTSSQREVVLLRVVADLNISQTAYILGKSEGAIKTLHHKAIARLRSLLEKDQEDQVS